MAETREFRPNPHALEHSRRLSARDSGALSFMPTAEVQTYADSYGQQEIINREAIAIFTRQTELAAPLIMETDPAQIRPADVQTLLSNTAVIYIRLTTLKQLIEQLDKTTSRLCENRTVRSTHGIPDRGRWIYVPGDAAMGWPAMIDVHPPHSAVHGWRDFFIHLATITIGLFIALMLESGVEALHHRHIVREARENIRREIEENRAQAKENLAYLQQNADSMKRNIQVARTLRDGQKIKAFNMAFQFTWSSFNGSAWLSARDSGALTYMPTAEVQGYADSYNQQEIVNQQAVATFTHEYELAAPFYMEEDKSRLTPDESSELLKGVRSPTFGSLR